MRRIVVVGTTGSGKTHTARELAARFGLPHVELDALRWDPDWHEATNDVFRERVAAALTGDAWVVDGNYSMARDLVWPRADTLVWLDYPLGLILWRLLRRTVRRIARRERLWNDNVERFSGAFFSRQSLFVWALRTHGRRRREYPDAIATHPGLEAHRFRSPAELRRWLRSLPSTR